MMGRRKITFVWLVAALASLGFRPCALAQPAKSRQDLLKTIGLNRPVITQAADFSLHEASGGFSSLAQYRGALVLLNFWATWCPPCREEMPSMERLNRTFGGQGLAVVAINQRENAALVSRFMKTHSLNFPAPLDMDGRVAASYRVYGIPVTYLIDNNGRAIGMKSGAHDWALPAVIDAFRKLIAERRGSVSAGAMNLPPGAPLPPTVRAKSKGTSVRSQQDARSEAVAELGPDEEIVPLGRVSGAGEVWYFVKTKRGIVGWVRGGDLEPGGKVE
ncbi:MAG TPA: redoxin domain-containing protein [Verrucomicrobiae bacterium]|nr:redoxin domain-containing protein [Verrucomicrobiae bacterium]